MGIVEQETCRLFQLFQLQPVTKRVKPGCLLSKRVLAKRYVVFIGAMIGVKASVSLRCNGNDIINDYVCRQKFVHPAQQSLREDTLEIKVSEVSTGMNACISTTASHDFDRC